MNRVTFPLKLRMRGPAVSDLQAVLQLLLDRQVIVFDNETARKKEFKALKKEQIGQTYGATTKKLVALFQYSRRLKSTGTVDKATANELNRFLDEIEAPQDPASSSQTEGRPSWRVLRLTDPVMTGADVTEVHNQLTQLSEPYRSLIQADIGPDSRHQFGDATKQAVTRLQEQYVEQLRRSSGSEHTDRHGEWWTGEWGAVDSRTASLLQTLTRERKIPFIIRGRVEYADGTPAEGVRVTAYDRDIGTSSVPLGPPEAVYITNANGIFPDIEYFSADYDAAEGQRGPTADVVFTVSTTQGVPVELQAVYRLVGHPGAKQAESKIDLIVGFPASPIESVRLVVRRSDAVAPSEYERLMISLRPLLGRGYSPDQFDEEQHRDVTFAARETGEPREFLSTLVRAWVLAKPTTMSPECFYGLLRDGPPTTVSPPSFSPEQFISDYRPGWSAKLEEAFELQLIPAALKSRLNTWLDELDEYQAKAFLHFSGDARDQVSLGDVLRFGKLPESQQIAYAKLSRDHTGDEETLWQKVEQELGWRPEQIKVAREALDLSDLVHGHKPFLQQLYDRTQPPTTRLLASWDRAQLDQLIAQVGVPRHFAESSSTAMQAYGDAIERILQSLHPSLYVSKALRRVEDTDIHAAGEWLHEMLLEPEMRQDGIPPFNLISTPATRYLAEHGDRLFHGVSPEDRQRRSSQLKRVQRAFQLSTGPTQVGTLLKHGLDSARHISSWSKEHFVAQYGPLLGGADAAGEVHSKAGYIHATLLHAYIDGWHALRVPRPGIPSLGAQHTAGLIASKLPTLDKLLADTARCSCPGELSVLSPAAYLVDLLQFLDVTLPGSSEPIVKSLLKRRPDLEHIQLTIENTNTRTPYIDLVNGILMSFIAHNGPFPFNDPKDGVITATAEELRINPIPITPEVTESERKAYTSLLGAVYPWSLPYNHWLETMRQFLSPFGVTRTALLRLFPSDEEVTTNFAIATEALSLSPQDFGAITGTHFGGASSDIGGTLPIRYGFDDRPDTVADAPLHVRPLLTSGDHRERLIDALQNFFKNVSNSSGLTPALRKDIFITGEYDEPTVKAVEAYRVAVGLPAIGGTDNAFWATFDSTGASSSSFFLSYVPLFLQQTGLSFDEVVELLTTQFFNRLFRHRVFLERLHVRPEEVMAFLQSGVTTIPSSLQTKLSGATPPVSEEEFIDWTKRHSSMLVLDSPPHALCDVSQTTIRHLEGSLLRDQDLDRLEFALRLRTKLGWSIHEIDLVLSTFPVDKLTMMLRLADIHVLRAELKLPLDQLMTFWGPLDHRAEGSLYDQLFRSKSAQALDPHYELDSVRAELKDHDEHLEDHVPLLLAALRISDADFNRCLGDPAFGVVTPTPDAVFGLKLDSDNKPLLNLANLSMLYRVVRLAKALNLSVEEFLRLQALSDINIFEKPEGQPQSKVMEFVRVARMVQSSGLTVRQLGYVWSHGDGPDSGQKLSLDASRALVGMLRSGLDSIAEECTVGEDPTGELFLTQLRKALPGDAADELYHMVYGSVTYSLPLEGAFTSGPLPPSIKSKFTYEAATKTVRFSGVMTTEERDALLAPSFIDTIPSALQTLFKDRVASLFDMPEAYVKQKLALHEKYGELTAILRQTSSLNSSSQPNVEAIRQKVVRILAPVQRIRSEDFLIQTCTDTFQIEPASIRLFLNNSTVLSSLRFGESAPAAADLFEMVGLGLHASYYSGVDLDSPGSTGAEVASRMESRVELNLSTDLPSEVTTEKFSTRWTGFLYAPLTETITFMARGRGTMRFWLNQQLVLQQPTADSFELSVGIKLEKGSLNAVMIEHAHHGEDRAFQWTWSIPNRQPEPIPSISLYTEELLQTYARALLRLDKLALLVNAHRVTAEDVWGLAHLGLFDWNSVPTTEPSPAESASFFMKWLTLARYIEVRNQITTAHGKFRDILDSDTLSTALKRFAAVTGTTESDLVTYSEAATLHPFDPMSQTYSEVPPSPTDLTWWASLRQACNIQKKTGCSASQLVEWCRVKTDVRTAPNPPETTSYAFTAQEGLQPQELCDALKRLLKAKYEEETWRVVARPLNDELRTRNRDALVAYILTLPDIRQAHIKTGDQLLTYFFLDTQMSACMETSLIASATHTVQVFVTAVLRGHFETAVPPIPASAIDRYKWETWMKTYQLWRPARDIFIRTPLYIRWNLLDRKSEAFRAFEQDLRKQDLTDAERPDLPPGHWAEKAFMNFLEKLDEVAKLEICGQYHDAEARILHVFGRTQSQPYRFYYRTLNNYTGLGPTQGEWSAWERVPLDIDIAPDEKTSGVHLMPVVWNRRLYLFWPVFRSVPADEENAKIPQEFDRVNSWDIRLAWSELWDGVWSPRQMSLQSIATRPFFQPPRVQDHLKVDIPYKYEEKYEFQDVEIMVAGRKTKQKRRVTHRHPARVQNDLLPDGGITIDKLEDYARYQEIVTEQRSVSYLPKPSEHLFYVKDRQGVLFISCFTRYLGARAKGQLLSSRKRSLTVMQSGRLTVREDIEGPTVRPTSDYVTAYDEVGIFRVGTCKVRDVDTLPAPKTGLSYNYFSEPLATWNSYLASLQPNAGYPGMHLKLADRDVLAKTSDGFLVVGSIRETGFDDKTPFFFQDPHRVYFVAPLVSKHVRVFPQWGDKVGDGKTVTIKASGGYIPLGFTRWSLEDFGGKTSVDRSGKELSKSLFPKPELIFEQHCHPQICEYIRRLNRHGLYALLSTDTQRLSDTDPSYFKVNYEPTTVVDRRYPSDRVDFDLHGAYSQYNMELFLYAPMLAHTALLNAFNFTASERFLKVVLNLTSADTSKSPIERIWQFLPFQSTQEEYLQGMLDALAYTGTENLQLLAKKSAMQDAIRDWMKDPYNPHAIARRRPSAYKEAILLDCCRFHLKKADYHFTKFTMEQIHLALQDLIIVGTLMNWKRPAPRGEQTGRVAPETYASLRAKNHLSSFSDFSVAMADLETEFPFAHSTPVVSGSTGSVDSVLTTYFCLPGNDEWERLWDTMTDRLYKIRHCMNIEGEVQDIPLFPPEIDPMLLVEARAKGLNISSLLDQVRTPVPHQDFGVVFEKASRAVQDGLSLYQRFESFIEKSESQGLAELKIEQEADWLKNYLRHELVQGVQLQSAMVDALNVTYDATKRRQDYYDHLLTQGLLDAERDQRTSLNRAASEETKAQQAELAANAYSMIPDTSTGTCGVQFGGTHLGAAARAIAGEFRASSASYSHRASNASLAAQWDRQKQEWAFQRDQARVDLKRIDKELAAKRIEKRLAELKLENHDKTVANTEAVLTFYKQSFFSGERYQKSASDLYPDIFQLFHIAFEYCRAAEAKYCWDFGLNQSQFVQFGYWSQGDKGLLAFEHLQLALKQVEKAYFESDRRDFELTRTVSLIRLDPKAFLTLKQTGECEFEVPEAFFDGDYPGHYMRRLRRVSVTIPCVTGPYTNVNCTLTLLENTTRVSSEVREPHTEELEREDKRFRHDFGAIQSIVTSRGLNDLGVLEPGMATGLPLPFKGAGAVSRWRVKLPINTNHWPRSSMSDLLLELQFSARPGGARLEEKALGAREAWLGTSTQSFFLIGKGLPNDKLYHFLAPAKGINGHILSFDLSPEIVSNAFSERTLKLSSLSIMLNFHKQSDNGSIETGIDSMLSHQSSEMSTPDSLGTAKLQSIEADLRGTPRAQFPLTIDLTSGVTTTMTWEIPASSVSELPSQLREPIPGTTQYRLKRDLIDDIWILVNYTVVPVTPET